MKDIPSPESNLNFWKSDIIQVDKVAEEGALDLYADSLNSEKSLEELFMLYIERFVQSDLLEQFGEKEKTIVWSFYILRLAGYLRKLFDDENPGDWLDDKETEAEVWLKHNATSEYEILKIGWLALDIFRLHHHITSRTTIEINQLLH